MILVWIGGGLVVEVCAFWFGSARWVCFGLSKGFVGCDERWPVVARSQSGRAHHHGYGFFKKKLLIWVCLGLVLLWVLVLF